MRTLEELLKKKKNQVDLWNDRIISNKSNENKFSGNFHYYHLLLAVNYLDKADLFNAKINYNVCALIDELRIIKYNNRQLDYSNYINYAVLTDNEPLIQQYSKLRYQKGKNAELSMDEMVLQGESAIWCNTIQFFMANDIKGVERNLNIIETLTLPKLPKNQQELKLDYEFYKALLGKDKSKCEEILEQLVSPKIHKKRNDNTVLNKYVSQPALGYAKLAWRQGLEVEVNSPLIPKEILPIEPLDNYEIPYDFLKDEIS